MFRFILENKKSIFLLTAITSIFFVFSHNSSIGYDAYEYLLIGRYLSEGGSLYDYWPSKSPGIYYFISVLSWSGLSFNHIQVALLLSVLFYITALILLYYYRNYSAESKYLLICFLAFIYFFTEMNFIQPDQFVIIFSVISSFLFSKSLDQISDGVINYKSLFTAGVFLSFAMLFKTTAIFVGLGFFIYALYLAIKNCLNAKLIVNSASAFIFGFASVFMVASAYFWSTGEFADFINWTFLYPMNAYPAHTLYLDRVYTKLLGLNLLYIASLFIFVRKILNSFFLSQRSWLFLCVSLSAMLIVFKTQAPHYFTLSYVFMLLMFVESNKTLQINRNNLMVVLIIGLLAISSILMYRPSALNRLIEFKSYDYEEQGVVNLIKKNTTEKDLVLFISSDDTKLYWLTNRMPPRPLLSTDVKHGWLMRNNFESFSKRVDNKNLKYILADDENYSLTDEVFGKDPKDFKLMDKFFEKIRSTYQMSYIDYKSNMYPAWVNINE